MYAIYSPIFSAENNNNNIIYIIYKTICKFGVITEYPVSVLSLYTYAYNNII